MKKIYLLFLLPVFVASACHTFPEKKVSALTNDVNVQIFTLSSSDWMNEREYIGTVEESTNVLLSFPTLGRVVKVYANEGQYVRKGQLLAELDSTTLVNLHATSLATLHQAEDGFQRVSMLYESNSIPEVQYIGIKTQLEQARAAERISAEALKNARLYAPENGVIGKKMLEVGLNALPDQPVYSLMNTQTLVVKVAIPENEIFATKVGQKARILVNALDGQQTLAHVMEKGVKAQPFTHSYDIKLALNQSLQGLLPGMACKVFIQNLPQETALVVPSKAVLPADFGKGYFVWIVDNDNVAHRRPITIGDLAPGGIIVKEGLSVGDRIVVSGYQKVSENILVKVTNE